MKALLDRLANEPVLLLGTILALLTALQSATAEGLSPANLLIAVVIAGISFLTRELTVPMTKVRSGEIVIEEADDSPVGDPFIPGEPFDV